jgi:hypothetical protein
MTLPPAVIQASGRPMIIQIGAGDHMPLLHNPNASLGNSCAATFTPRDPTRPP